MSEIKCPKCGSDTSCLAGESAHPNNWYCEDEDGCGWQAWNKEKIRKQAQSELLEEFNLNHRLDVARREQDSGDSKAYEYWKGAGDSLQSLIDKLDKP